MRNATLLSFLLLSIVSFSQKKDSAFTETSVVLHTATGDIFGTVTTPDHFTKGPVTLIIAGSGPTDRNGNNPAMKNESLRGLAYGLAKKGIASLRYDKRGIGESAASMKREDSLRFEDYIRDAADWVSFLKKDKRYTKVFIAGHSEGSLIGMVAASKGADGFISIAGPARPAYNVIKEQLSKQPANIRDTCYAIIDSLTAGRTVPNVNPFLYQLFRPSVQPYLISWFRYDPQSEIKKLNMPVLILQGTKDLQVPASEAGLLFDARGNAAVKKVIITNMNHVLKLVEGDEKANIAAYSNPSIPVASELIESITAFINKTSAVKK